MKCNRELWKTRFLAHSDDPSSVPPTYQYLDANLDALEIVNMCCVPDDETAFDFCAKVYDTFGVAPRYIQKKQPDEKYLLLPWAYDAILNEVLPLGDATV
jgi:hypothetical protein